MLKTRWVGFGFAVMLCVSIGVGGATPAQAQQNIDTSKMTSDQIKNLRTGSRLHGKARHHYDWGRYDAAISTVKQAQAIVEPILGKGHPLISTFMNDLAYYHAAKGDFGPVEGLFKEVVARNDKYQGKESVEAATARERLANFYMDRRLFAKAEPLYKKAEASLRKKSKDKKAAYHLPRMMTHLARCNVQNGKLKEAEKGYQSALKLAEKTFGKGDLETGKFINDLALFYTKERGRHKEAKRLLTRLLSIIEPKLGEMSVRVRTAKLNLGMTHLRTGRYKEAEALFKARYKGDSSDAAQAELGLTRWTNRMAVASSVLGENYWAMGELDKAIALWGEAGEFQAARESAMLTVGSEQERLLFAAGLIANVNAFVSMHVQSAPNNTKAAENALLRVLRAKGRVVEAQADTFRAAREGLEPGVKHLVSELSGMRATLARLALQGRKKDEQARLTQEIEEIERRLAESSSALVNATQLVSLAKIRAGLPAKGALVEFVRYQPFDVRTRKHGAPRYAVYLFPKEGDVFGMDLGDAQTIERDVEGFRKLLSTRGPLDAEASSLYGRLVKPWIGKLPAVKHLVMAPDAALNLLPFEALKGKDGFLARSYLVTYLTTGRRLMELRVKAPSQASALIIADPDYGAARRGRKPKGKSTRSALAGFTWQRLPGTATEGKALNALLKGSRLVMGKQATEQALTTIKSPRILHLATHGFFLSDAATGGEASARGFVVKQEQAQEELVEALSTLENPLLRSGLVLAGANSKGRGDADGYMTALEASGLDLSGTQLVVMSACETGVGEVTVGQGVFGLRRAMVFAGSEAQVMSLWKVADEATMELMRLFYSKLVAGQPRGEAMHQARLELAATAKWAHPYFWSAFILSGNWEKLR